MKDKANIIVNINKTEVQTINEIKLSKLKNLTIRESKSNSQRPNTKIESMRTKYQEIISQLNILLVKDKERKKLIKKEQKHKKSLDDIGSLNITPKLISSGKDDNMTKNLSSLDSFSINIGNEIKNLFMTKSEVLEPGVLEVTRKDENDRCIANIKRKEKKKFVNRREEDKLNRSGSDSEE